MSKYKPDGKCGTCRHLTHRASGDGFHEPVVYDQECMLEDELIQIGQIRMNVDDEFGPDGIEGCGVTKPCPLYLPLAECEKHGKRKTGEFGCPDCDAAAYDELAKDLAEAETLATEGHR